MWGEVEQEEVPEYQMEDSSEEELDSKTDIDEPSEIQNIPISGIKTPGEG